MATSSRLLFFLGGGSHLNIQHSIMQLARAVFILCFRFASERNERANFGTVLHSITIFESLFPS